MFTGINTYLPGDRKPDDLIKQMIRVDHSGEKGAIEIYAGQMLAAKHLQKLSLLFGKDTDAKFLEQVKEMRAHEMVHYEYFKNILHESRPSFLINIWSLFGFMSGYFTTLMGEKIAMGLTAEVEKVIVQHYSNQLSALEKIKKSHANTVSLENFSSQIEKFMYDELEHLGMGQKWEANKTCGYFYFSALVKFVTKTAIDIAKQI